MAKVNSTTILAIVIVVLFVGSMIASTAFLGSNVRDTEPNDNNQQNQPTQEDYKQYSTQLDVNVLQIFPRLVVSGEPKTYEKTKLEDIFSNIDGIEEVKINFNKDQNNNILFLGNITYDGNKESIIKEIQDINNISNTQIYQHGLLEVPNNIDFTLSTDQNKIKEYYLAAGKIEGIISNKTLKEDKINAQIQAVFVKDQLYRINAVEMQNISSTPKQVSGAKLYEIESWNPEYLINTESSFINNADYNSLFDYNYSFRKNINGSLIYDINSLEETSDLNKNLQNIKDQNNSFLEDIVIDSNKNKLDIYFLENATINDYNNLKHNLDINHELGLSNIISDINNAIYFTIYESEIDQNTVKNKLNENNIFINNIKRSAKIDISDTNINNVQYKYDQNLTDTLLRYPENKNKEKVKFDVSGFASRNKLMYFMINEHIEEE